MTMHCTVLMEMRALSKCMLAYGRAAFPGHAGLAPRACAWLSAFLSCLERPNTFLNEGLCTCIFHGDL